MATKADICNQALAHLGQTVSVSNIDTEQTPEARTLRLFWDTAKNAVLEDFTWPFATKYVQLALRDENPNEIEWAYCYKYPNDCVFVRRIFSGIRNDNAQSRVPYLIAQVEGGLSIFTDMEDAIIEFTSKCDNPGIFPPSFILGLGMRLAAYIAPQITKGDQYKLGERALNSYGVHISRAIANRKNEEQRDEKPESELLRSRS